MYAVEHISTKKRQEVHANALRFYHDSSLNVELSVEEQLAFDEARVYEVEEIQDVQKRGENDFSFLPKLSLGLDIWEVSIGCAIWTAQKTLPAAGLEPGCAISACDLCFEQLYISYSSLWKGEVYDTHVWC